MCGEFVFLFYFIAYVIIWFVSGNTIFKLLIFLRLRPVGNVALNHYIALMGKSELINELCLERNYSYGLS